MNTKKKLLVKSIINILLFQDTSSPKCHFKGCDLVLLPW